MPPPEALYELFKLITPENVSNRPFPDSAISSVLYVEFSGVFWHPLASGILKGGGGPLPGGNDIRVTPGMTVR